MQISSPWLLFQFWSPQELSYRNVFIGCIEDCLSDWLPSVKPDYAKVVRIHVYMIANKAHMSVFIISKVPAFDLYVLLARCICSATIILYDKLVLLSAMMWVYGHTICNKYTRPVESTRTGPFHCWDGWHVLTSIPAWINNYIYYKVWGEITYPFPKCDSLIQNQIW